MGDEGGCSTRQTKIDLNKTMDIALRRLRQIIIVVEKAISITYSECAFVAFCIQHAKRMRRFILLSVACPALFFHIISQMPRFPEIHFIEYMLYVF
jgi:hypothetical protein